MSKYYEMDEIKQGIPYTWDSRLIQLAEECSELVQACMKMLRLCACDKCIDSAQVHQNLLEEVGDVEIVMHQLKNKLDSCDIKAIENSKTEKIHREQQRLMMI